MEFIASCWLGVKWLVAGSYLYEQSRVEQDGAKHTCSEIRKKKKKKNIEKEKKYVLKCIIDHE